MLDTSFARLQDIFGDLDKDQLVRMIKLLKDMNSFEDPAKLEEDFGVMRLRDIAVAEACFAIAQLPEKEREMVLNLLISFKSVMEK